MIEPAASSEYRPVGGEFAVFKFHMALVDRKYRLLFFSALRRRKPGPKGPSAELRVAIAEMKRCERNFAYVCTAQQISLAFGIKIDKDVVRGVLAKHYRSGASGTNGPSCLTFLGHVSDSLWRLIGTIRREYLDRVCFWNAVDLARKLDEFRDHYNAHRVHRSLGATTPAQHPGASSPVPAALDQYAWRQHSHGLFETPGRGIPVNSPPTTLADTGGRAKNCVAGLLRLKTPRKDNPDAVPEVHLVVAGGANALVPRRILDDAVTELPNNYCRTAHPTNRSGTKMSW